MLGIRAVCCPRSVGGYQLPLQCVPHPGSTTKPLPAGAPSIRDVIAFPKTTTGQCLLTEAPSGVSDAQLADLHIAKAGAECCVGACPTSCCNQDTKPEADAQLADLHISEASTLHVQMDEAA